MLGSNPSAGPGAEMGRGGVPLCPCCLLAKAWPALGARSKYPVRWKSSSAAAPNSLCRCEGSLVPIHRMDP